ncbi:MAG: thioredoxin domain-containing protein [Magnetovibrio sp.]|nr:thioredoxin domain-containing protein [Magnetovibrio sp.]
MSQNHLKSETSPYLLQHKDNPVAWWPWSAEALDMARSENKPILLSIGYSACHWCHVMAHESFENQGVADVMNEHFINIKVDREERPDLDTLYQAALRTLKQQGGWPLTMVLTPEGKPFWGGTYFPREPRYGFPGFVDVLKNISAAWTNDQDSIQSNVLSIERALDFQDSSKSMTTLNYATLDQVGDILLSNCDTTLGGFMGAPKFPQAPILRFLWRTGLRLKQDRFLKQTQLTLHKMCDGGLYDHVGGGFARYSTDDRWLVPHFEKMLYDNALLITQMCLNWTQNADLLLKTRVYETIEWVMRDMRVETSRSDYGFATALDADSEGEEGLYYVWSASEVEDILGENAPLFKSAYDVNAAGNWAEAPSRDGANTCILNRSSRDPLSDADEAILKASRHKLLAHRSKRVAPGRDHKVLADLNGMMIQALVKAAIVFGEPKWLEAAQTSFAFVLKGLVVEGRLYRSWAKGQAKHLAVLDDLAQMGAAAIALYESTGNTTYLDQAILWVEEVELHFASLDSAGYYLNADDVTDIFKRSILFEDNATPSGNGVFAEVLARLYLITNQDIYRERVEKMIDAATSSNPADVAHMPTLLLAFDLLAGRQQVVLVGAPYDALLKACYTAPHANHVIVHGGADDLEKAPLEGQATAYVCAHGTCQRPVTSSEDLLQALETF